jgi:two-component system cell cycle sensor histidine kinase/response regulator CckA
MRESSARVASQAVILLVEDFKPLLLAMQTLLESARYTVLPAQTPAEALFASEHSGNKINLLLTRLLLPGMTGPALAAQIRTRAPNLAVLYMSDESHPWLGEPSEAVIRASLLPNPFCNKILLERVRSALSSRA